MKKKAENYLERIPCRKEGLRWSVQDEKVTLEIDNKGIFNKIAQKLLKKPLESACTHFVEQGNHSG